MQETNTFRTIKSASESSKYIIKNAKKHSGCCVTLKFKGELYDKDWSNQYRHISP